MPLLPRKPASGHAALRRGRVSLPGQVYLVTFITCRRRPLFADAGHAMVVARCIHTACLGRDTKLLAWVLMPDHWHGLLQLGERETLAGLVQHLKTNSARRLPADVARPVWARGFHDHALCREADLRGVARYIVMNPVRAGIVRSSGTYPYWNAVWL